VIARYGVPQVVKFSPLEIPGFTEQSPTCWTHVSPIAHISATRRTVHECEKKLIIRYVRPAP